MHEIIARAFEDELNKIGWWIFSGKKTQPSAPDTTPEISKGTVKDIKTRHKKSSSEFQAFHERMQERLKKMDELLAKAKARG